MRALKSGDHTEPFPDWFIRMTRPGIDLDPTLDENRTLIRRRYLRCASM